jgi:hypothetical protein
MTIKIKQLIVEKDPDVDQFIYTILTADSRIFVGGIHDGKFQWMELPGPNVNNTRTIPGSGPLT